jgi:hypothetical protein
MHTIQDPQMIVTIAWNPLGFHLFAARPKGNIFSAEHYRVDIFTELLSLRPQVDGRKLVTHADNAKPHTARKYRAFLKTISSALPHTHRTHLISHPPTSFSSDISYILCRESLFQFMKSSGHPATNLGRRVSALDGETRMGFSKQW